MNSSTTTKSRTRGRNSWRRRVDREYVDVVYVTAGLVDKGLECLNKKEEPSLPNSLSVGVIWNVLP